MFSARFNSPFNSSHYDLSLNILFTNFSSPSASEVVPPKLPFRFGRHFSKNMSFISLFSFQARSSFFKPFRGTTMYFYLRHDFYLVLAGDNSITNCLPSDKGACSTEPRPSRSSSTLFSRSKPMFW